MTKASRMAYLRCLFRKAAFTMPILASSTMKMGSSKITPKAMSNRRQRELLLVAGYISEDIGTAWKIVSLILKGSTLSPE